MPFTGRLDQANQFSLRGSVSADAFSAVLPFVDIVVNRRFIARVPARSFSFNPFEALLPGMNVVELFVAGSDQLLENGTQHISGDLPKTLPPDYETEVSIDCFMDEVEVLAQSELRGKVWAIGERVTRAVVEKGCQCQQSQDVTAEFDLVLAANVCEHWFPSIAKELCRIHHALRRGGLACLDFPYDDAALAISRAQLQGERAVFFRVYSELELRSFFLEAGLEIVEIVMCENKRVVVAAKKPDVTI